MKFKPINGKVQGLERDLLAVGWLVSGSDSWASGNCGIMPHTTKALHLNL